MSSNRRAIAIGAGLIAAASLALGVSNASGAGTRAHAARSLHVKDEAKVHLVHSSGSTLYDEGPASGTIPGTVKISFTYNGSPNVSANLTIASHSGSIKVHATGKLSSPTNPKPSFKGTLSVTGGSGRYAHAHGGGQLYGVFYRRSYAMIVQAEGTVSY